MKYKNLEKAQKGYEKVVIGSFVGRRLNYGFVKETIMLIWKLKNSFLIKTFGERMFSFEFNSIKDKNKVLNLGCFHITSTLCVV